MNAVRSASWAAPEHSGLQEAVRNWSVGQHHAETIRGGEDCVVSAQTAFSQVDACRKRREML